MADRGDEDRQASGGTTSNDVSGHVDGPVFQGRDFGDINIGAQMPAEQVAYYRRMQARLDKEEREERERREAHERNQRELAESQRRARQDAWNQRWDALVAERARLRKRAIGAFFTCVGTVIMIAVMAVLHHPDDKSLLLSMALLCLMVAFFASLVVGIATAFSLDRSRRTMNAHKSNI